MRNLIINLFFSHVDDLAYPTFAIFFSCLGFLGYFGVDIYYTVTSAVFNHEHRSEKDDFEKLDEIWALKHRILFDRNGSFNLAAVAITILAFFVATGFIVDVIRAFIY